MKWRDFAFFVVLILLGLLVLRNAGKLSQFVELLRHVNLWILILILPVRYAYYWASTRYYMHFFRLYKRELSYRELFGGVVSMNFLNTVVPSGGLSGAAYFAKQYEHKVTSRQNYLAQFFWSLAVFVSLVLVLGLSFVVLFFSNTIAQVSFRLVLLFISILLAASIAVITITISPNLFKRALKLVVQPANWVLKLIHRNPINDVQTNRFVDGYNDILGLLTENPKRAVRPFIDAFLTVLLEIISILVVFLAFGHWVNPGVIGSAYVLALITSVLSVFTAGVGAYEATMVAIFVALGVSFNLAFSVTAVYRLIAFWLFIPIGLYYYRRKTTNEVEE